METFEAKLLILLVLAVQFQRHYGCFEEERLGLLAFKSFVQSNGDDADRLLPSWTNHTNCCQWERVTCSSTTGHVTKLSLDDTKKAWDDGNYQNLTIWYLNLSIFEPFKELTALNLSINAIIELADDGNISDSDRFLKLENLDLSWNVLGSEVLKTLGKFPALKYLDLHTNFMQASLWENIQHLSSLKALSLSDNNLNGSIHQGLCRFDQLEELDISKNSFSGTLPLCLSKLASLRQLDLSSNRLSGKIPSGFGNLNGIHSFNLSRNHLTGYIPKTFSNLRRIESIDLSHNKLSGEIPPQLTNLRLLKFFCVAYNNLSGRVPEINGVSDKKSYEGNPFLCGFPLPKRCGNVFRLQEP